MWTRCRGEKVRQCSVQDGCACGLRVIGRQRVCGLAAAARLDVCCGGEAVACSGGDVAGVRGWTRRRRGVVFWGWEQSKMHCMDHVGMFGCVRRLELISS